MGKITIYGASWCKWCEKAKELAESNDLDFDYVDLDDNQDLKEWLLSQGYKTIPQVFNSNTHIGGYDGFVEFLEG